MAQRALNFGVATQKQKQLRPLSEPDFNDARALSCAKIALGSFQHNRPVLAGRLGAICGQCNCNLRPT